ncbi:hypothetical protein ACFL0D_03560 [Thermoproteota archaeon]
MSNVFLYQDDRINISLLILFDDEESGIAHIIDDWYSHVTLF